MLNFKFTSQVLDCAVTKRERNDCAVVAISMACDISYQSAIGITRRFGRRPNRGLKTTNMMKQNPVINGYRFEEMNHFTRNTRGLEWQDRAWKTVGSFVADHPTGRYLLQVSRHLLTLIDGTLIDSEHKPRRRLRNAWRVTR
jgi:hypothetical protein